MQRCKIAWISLIPPDLCSLADLEVLSFKSWWNEAGASGLTKRNIDIYFNVESNNFQVCGTHRVARACSPATVRGCLPRWCWTTQIRYIRYPISRCIRPRCPISLVSLAADSLPHLQGRYGPLTAWDLHVNAKIDILGRKTTLMQANFATSEWLEACADRLTTTKVRSCTARKPC